MTDETPPWRPTLSEIDALRERLRRAGGASMELAIGDVRLCITPAPPAALPGQTSAVTEPDPVPASTPQGATVDSTGPGILRLADPAGGAPCAPAGSEITSGQIVALLQAGSALWPVEARATGRIEAVLAEDGAVVGYGTPLLRLCP
jgi:biotin carboxyl carrier protein